MDDSGHSNKSTPDVLSSHSSVQSAQQSLQNLHLSNPDIANTPVTATATATATATSSIASPEPAMALSHIPNPPQFNNTRRSLRVTLTSPARKASVYDLAGKTTTREDMRKPRLLHSVVHEEEMRGILSRLTRPTMATRMRAVNFRPECQYTFVDMGRYQWNRMSVYSDYQRHMYTGLGAIQPGFKRTVKTYRPIYC